jgi:hypothetical protein
MSLDPIRSSAIDRIHHEELERQQAILDGVEFEKLEAVFQVRALIARWGIERGNDLGHESGERVGGCD